MEKIKGQQSRDAVQLRVTSGWCSAFIAAWYSAWARRPETGNFYSKSVPEREIKLVLGVG